MAGTPNSVGALPVGSLPQTPGGLAAEPDYNTAPQAGQLRERGNLGEAFGNFYDQYKDDQIKNVTRATDLAKASRDRLTQIWESGATNPNVQNDKRVHTQIASLYKNMGVTPPVNDKGQLDWNAMAPAKTMNELSPAMLTQLKEAQPEARQAMARSMHLVDADPGFLNAPAEATQARLQAFDKEYSTMIFGNQHSNMSGRAFQGWVNTNRNLIDQSHGQGAADALLNDKDIFDDIAKATSVNIGQQQATLDEIKARTKGLLGLTPEAQARIRDDDAKAKASTSLADLDKIKGNYTTAQLKDLPQLDAAKIAQLQQQAITGKATAAHLNELVETAKTTGLGAPDAQIRAALTAANADYKTASAAYISATNSGLGVPDEVKKAYTDSLANVTALEAARDNLANPDTKAAIAAARAAAGLGTPVVPTTNTPPKYQWSRKGVDAQGVEVGLGPDGKSYVRKNGQPAVLK